MTERRQGWDRRHEQRRNTAGRMSWKKTSGQTKYVGWLCDASPSSVSFIAAAWCKPAPGEEVELINPNRRTRRFQVTRTAFYDDNLSLIACRAAASR